MSPQEIIIELLDQIVKENGFTKEAELAKLLDVSTVTLWRWRNGYLDKSTKVLVPILWQRLAAAEVA